MSIYTSRVDPAACHIPNSGYRIVWARPKNLDWSKYDGTNGLGDHNSDFRPCLLKGSVDSRRLVIHGKAVHYPIDDFEFGAFLA